MVFVLAGATISCSDFLDKEVDLTQQADNIFSDYNNTRGFLANIYTYLPDAFHGYTDGQYLNASKDAMTDNAVSYWDVHYYHQVHNDAFDATNHQFANYYYNLDTWNAIPEESGFGAPRAAETLAEGQSLLVRLGLATENVAPMPVSFSTLGRMEGTTPCRKAVYALTLEGLPVRWSAELLRDDGPTRPAILIDPCYVTVVYSDEDGLLMLEGNWCSFEPLTRASEVLRAEDALPLFRQAGLVNTDDDSSALEECWFLSVNGQEATATLAWRVGNSYLSAVDGTWLQTEN